MFIIEEKNVPDITLNSGQPQMLQILCRSVRVKIILQYNFTGSAYVYQHLFNLFCVVVAVFVMICGGFFGVGRCFCHVLFCGRFFGFVVACCSGLSIWLG